MSSLFYKLGGDYATSLLGLASLRVKTAAEELWDYWLEAFNKVAMTHAAERFAQRTGLPSRMLEHVNQFLDNVNRHSHKLGKLPEQLYLKMPDESMAALTRVASPAGGHRLVYSTHLAKGMVPKGTELTRELLAKHIR
jgi:hypothetical protein